MPTPEASASSSVALRNTNITDLAIEEADSFKGNVSTSVMTQDQCLDNGHRANSNDRSLNDKVSDDLDNSKNSVVSNGVNSVKEFNVDVNREYSTELVIVQNPIVDAENPPTGEVLPISKQLSDCVSSEEIFDNSINNIDAKRSECANNNIVADMTVITHQNSSENIRDIIANSEKANKNSSDSQISKVGKSVSSDVNQLSSISANKSVGIRRSRKLIRSENVTEGENDQIEDPIERLNKLRASISSALSEVKGVLKQYSTEQSCEEQNESAPSKQQSTDDGPVRFRFVRKIRRRSVFSEDDQTEIPKTSSDITTSPILENKVIEDVSTKVKVQEVQKTLTNQNQDKNNVPPSPHCEDFKQPVEKEIEHTNQKPQAEVQKTKDEDSSNVISITPPVLSSSETPKLKNGKTKKVLKKGRRASIAAVEINQISNDQPQIPLELKTQRRPSDSETLLKQTTRIKAKTSEKSKIVLIRKPKTSSSSKTEEPKVFESDAVPSTTEKLSPPSTVDSSKALDKQSSDRGVSDKPTDNTLNLASSNIQTNTTEISPAASSLETPKLAVDTKSSENNQLNLFSTEINNSKATIGVSEILPQVTEVKTEDKTSLAASETTSIPEVSSPLDIGVSEAPSDSSVQLNAPQIIAEPALSSLTILDVPKTSAKETETSSTTTGTSVSKTLTSDVTSSLKDTDMQKTSSEITQTDALNSKLKDDLSETKPTAPLDAVESKTNDTLIPSSQNIKTNTDFPYTGTQTQQITTSKQLPKFVSMNKATPKDGSGASKSTVTPTAVAKTKTSNQNSIQSKHQIKTSTETKQIQDSKVTPIKSTKALKTTEKVANKKPVQSIESSTVTHASSNSLPQKSEKTVESSSETNKKSSVETQDIESSAGEPDVPLPSKVPKDAVAVKFNLPGQESVEELQRLEDKEEDKETSPTQTTEETTAAPKKKRKAKRKVVIRRIKRKLSKDDTFLLPQETAAELEICEKEIEEKDPDEEPEEDLSDTPKQPKSCLKSRQYEIGDVVMYAEHYKKTQVRWKKAIVTERITSISYKLNINGEERPAHISYIKKFTDRKVNFGGKEYLEIDYAQIEEDEEKERNYSIWNLV